MTMLDDRDRMLLETIRAHSRLYEENLRFREALEHARARFECLADDFKDDENNVNWAMCSVDAERMAKALTVADRTAHKVMTPEEYAAMPIAGWHEVCRDVDGFDGIGVRFLGITALPNGHQGGAV